MLPIHEPAKIIPFLYKMNLVRFHLHSEDSSVWVVGSDICHILDRTNPSYFSGCLPKEAVYKHKLKTDSGSQTILWFKMDAIKQYCPSEFNAWYDTLVIPNLKPTLGSIKPEHTFTDPILVERKDLEDLVNAFKKITPYLYP